MGHARAASFVGSAGRWVAASWACCGTRAASVVGEWWCVAGVYCLNAGGGGLWAWVWGGSAVGYRLVAGAGASLWVGLPRCLLDVSRGGPWLAG